MKSATSQVGTEAAVEAYYNSLSDQLVFWFNPVWKNKPVAYIKPKSKDGSKFYEDSITVEIHDILLMGAYANENWGFFFSFTTKINTRTCSTEHLKGND